MSGSQYGLECEPGGQPTVLGPTPEPTHTGCPGGSSTPGLIGGWTCPCECHKRKASAGKRGLTTAQSYLLNQACRPVRRAFGCSGPYLVGTAAVGPDFRDVDVRVILHDDDFDALFEEREPLWDLLCMSVSLYLSNATGLPVDFQVQRMTEANEKYDGPRQALGINAEPANRFAGGGDATPSRCPDCGTRPAVAGHRDDCRSAASLTSPPVDVVAADSASPSAQPVQPEDIQARDAWMDALDPEQER